MKGLLIKDFRLMKGQKTFFLAIVAISILTAVTSSNTLFAISFLGFVCPMFVLSSISYDEFDNGNAFLFSLPITRKGYVFEKYIFGLILSIAALIFSTAVCLIISVIKNTVSINEIFITALTVFPAELLILSLMLPFQLKFGAEKGRIAIIAVLGGVSVIGVLLAKAAEAMNINLYELLNAVSKLCMQTFFLLYLLISFIILIISCRISIKVINKKEF